MRSEKSRSFKNRIKKFAHVFAGVVILIHAYEKHESGHDSYLFFAIAGLIFLMIAFLHSPIEKKLPWVDGVFFIIEASLCFVIAYEYFHAGKKALPVCYVVAGLAQLVGAFARSRQQLKKHKAAANNGI